MRRASVTLNDVAAQAGVSKTTAASILRDARGLRASSETRQRVLEASVRLGYQRNAVAASLSTGRTRTLGMLMSIEEITSDTHVARVYAQDLFIAVFKAASRADLRVVPVPVSAEGGLSSQSVTDRRIDGLILASFYDDTFRRSVEEKGVPCVTIGSGTSSYLVQPDNEAGAESVVAHLSALGHRRIAHWHGGVAGYASQRRHVGFEVAARRFGIETMLVWDTQTTADLLQRGAPQRPTALFAFSDHYARIVLGIARDLGLRVPEDLSIVGFDNNVLAETAFPPLTTVHNPLDEQAGAAVSLLQTLLLGKKPERSHIVLPTHLVIRGSTGPAPESPGK